MRRIKVVIVGAAGRDFHDFNVVFRDDERYEVVAFTAAQIPNISGRVYPASLAGRLYPLGIPIYPERDLDRLIAAAGVEQVVFAYSDVSHGAVMHLAARALARGAEFRLLGPAATMLKAAKPVVSLTAVRTGCGKSAAARRVAAILREAGRRVAVIRHPMPYGDLARQAVQRFTRVEDLAAAECTIEEREEYEPHLAAGDVVFAGVDYARIVRQAERECDVLVWDGGNNDTPFLVPDVDIVLVDPHRSGDERGYFPGEVNLRRAQVVLLTKLDSADADAVARTRASVAELNPQARVIDSAMPLRVDDPARIRGKRVLVIEDGPTLTHGGMTFGAGTLAARRFGAREIVDPRPAAVGSLRRVYEDYPGLGPVLPAMGYGPAQLSDLARTIAGVDCDTVVLGTPADLARLLPLARPAVRVTYEIEEIGEPNLRSVLRELTHPSETGA